MQTKLIEIMNIQFTSLLLVDINRYVLRTTVSVTKQLLINFLVDVEKYLAQICNVYTAAYGHCS